MIMITRLILDNYYLICYRGSVIKIYQWIINNNVALFAPACLKLGFATRHYIHGVATVHYNLDYRVPVSGLMIK